MKVGRNDLCPCGSGLKFKKCHLNMPPLGHQSAPQPTPPLISPRILRQFQQHQLEHQTRESTYGKVRPIIQIPNHANHRFVVVKNRLYFMEKERWKYFTDFLLYYGLARFGKEWIEREKDAAPSNQHPAYAWRNQAYAFMGRQTRLPGGDFTAIPNGTLTALLAFYYDLYIVDDNGMLDEALLERLKHRDQFQGALHELFAEATCLRAGFTILREKERERFKKQVEFIAVHKSSAQHILVEAKSRHRPGVMGRPGARDTSPDLRFRGLINDAVKKDPNNPLALFVDTNLPHDRATRFFTPESGNPIVPSRAMRGLLDKVCSDHGGVDPYNILVLSNHPQHYSEDDNVAPANQLAVIISQKPRVRVYSEPALTDLLNAANLYGNVPTHFPIDRHREQDF